MREELMLGKDVGHEGKEGMYDKDERTEGKDE